MFEPRATDHILSPYTGFTRETWIEAGKYLLSGVFTNKKNYDEPPLVKRLEFDITYPHKREGGYSENEIKAELFEGLARTMLIAAPLIKCDPDVEIKGFRLVDYYKDQIAFACDPSHKNYIGTYDDLRRITGNDEFACFQQTVETCALVICLDLCEHEIWDLFTVRERDNIVKLLLSYGHGSTVPQNWRFFNMLTLAFLFRHGVEIDREIMLEHAKETMNYYAGDGWYRDGQNFDYYSCWAFHVYSQIWNRWYGRKYLPQIAKHFDENFKVFMKTYPRFFDSDGFVNMWGRSNIYRFAAVSPFSECDADTFSREFFGNARRICSGALLQFLSRDDFLNDGTPAMGFYGQFSPLVQGYSCAESPFWFGKAFLCLALPKDHPFWTATENNGVWEKAKIEEYSDIPQKVSLRGPALYISNHLATGETVLRTAKVFKAPGDEHGLWNYGKLSYNTKYPWEADSRSQQYELTDLTNRSVSYANAIFLNGEKDGVLYRRQFFNFDHTKEMHWMQALDLADFPVANGIVRVDRPRLFRRPVKLTLGSYGFPDNGTVIRRENAIFEIVKSFETVCRPAEMKAVVLSGADHMGVRRNMAFVTAFGWDELEVIDNTGTNPDSDHSKFVLATCERSKQYGAFAPGVLISACLSKPGDEGFTEDELFFIEKIRFSDDECLGNYGRIRLDLKNGEVWSVDFAGIEGCLML